MQALHAGLLMAVLVLDSLTEGTVIPLCITVVLYYDDTV